ncbi:MAG: MmgE/PrpD family protein [Xanthobacteraceae bacterium]|nr:MmgE/PrpD family protein [Xanthobacteraceae bacterium]
MPVEVQSTIPAVNAIAAFATRASAGALKPDARRLLKRNILDSLGCAIAALPGAPFAALRDQFAEYRSGGSCSLIGGGRTAPDQAALFNSGLVRYVDLLDSHMSPGGLCHPADNFGAILAAAEHAQASGEAFMLALAVAYEIQCRFSAVVPVMEKGFNHATQLAISAAAGTGKLLGLSEREIAHAISIATADNISLACVHTEPVSQWKGFSPGMTGMRAVYSASLAKRGFTGPSGLFEGPNGLERMFGQKLDVDWSDDSLEIIHQTILKRFCSLIHGQPVLEAVLGLKRDNWLDPRDIETVRCDIFQSGFDIGGGGSFGSKDGPRFKEQADYNLKYLIAVALLDDQVGPVQLEQSRIRADDVQGLLRRVDIRPDDDFSARYPRELNTRISIQLKNGKALVREQLGYEGDLSRPLSWEREVEKFNWLSEPFADAALRSDIIQMVARLEEHTVADLTGLLMKVSPTAVFPVNNPGIQ